MRNHPSAESNCDLSTGKSLESFLKNYVNSLPTTESKIFSEFSFENRFITIVQWESAHSASYDYKIYNFAYTYPVLVLIKDVKISASYFLMSCTEILSE